MISSSRPSSRTRSLVVAVAAGLLAVAAFFVLPLVGRTTYSPDVWARYPTESRPISQLDPRAKIFWAERLPKTTLAMLAGAGLALAGLATQTLFRNSLATPYTLGIASGAAFGATTAIQFSATLVAAGLPLSFVGLPQVVWGAFFGAFLSTAFVLAATSRSRSPERTLLAGVAIGFFFSSLILCEQYLTNPTKAFVAIRWTTGGIDLCEPACLIATAVAALGVGGVFFCRARELDVLSLGDERAASLGVDVRRARLRLFLLSSGLVATIVAFCGPIGFVGLTVPHLCRLFVGNEHRFLIPTTFFGGAVFLGACYAASRVLVFPGVLPVGVVTSLLGGPFFLWVLTTKSR